MKKIAFTLLIAVLAFSAQADTGQYTVNDQAIENVFANSTDISAQSLLLNGATDILLTGSGLSSAMDANASISSNKNFAAAILLDFFLGGLGIHRLYLGTKTMTWVGYILTCGGIFGIVPLIDFVVLIINNEDISPYVDNPKFFMWAN